MIEHYPIVEIIRLEESHKYGTFGVLRINKQVLCCTLEQDDEENAANVSSIPAQQYMCESYVSEKFGRTYKVLNVPGRDNVLFHRGNSIHDTAGCILLGSSFGELQGDRRIVKSRVAFERFLEALIEDEKFHLTITEHY